MWYGGNVVAASGDGDLPRSFVPHPTPADRQLRPREDEGKTSRRADQAGADGRLEEIDTEQQLVPSVVLRTWQASQPASQAACLTTCLLAA